MIVGTLAAAAVTGCVFVDEEATNHAPELRAERAALRLFGVAGLVVAAHDAGVLGGDLRSEEHDVGADKHPKEEDHDGGKGAVLYRRVLEPLGYECVTDLSEVDQAKCSVLLRRKP